jgi:hypothetical protein
VQYGRHSFAHTLSSTYQVVTRYHVQCGGRLSAYTELSPYQLVIQNREAADFGVYAHIMPAEIEAKERRNAVQHEQDIRERQEADAEQTAYVADLYSQAKEMQDVQRQFELSTPILHADNIVFTIKPTAPAQIDTQQRAQADATTQRHNTPPQS